MRDSKGYLGLELAGAKNQKTALAAIEFYPKEKKIFLLDTYDKISGDDALLELIDEIKPGVVKMGVNVPLDLPPCTVCTRKSCPLPSKCRVPAVKWMREYSKKAAKNPQNEIRVKEFTPYTQRPVELWVRYSVLSKLTEAQRFEVDEALGGNKAPLTARMNFLKRHLTDVELVETWPKLSIATLANQLNINKRAISSYRNLEQGSHARSEILTSLAHHHGIFIYDRDAKKLASSLPAFDAFICAYTALLSDAEQCTKIPNGFPQSMGWVHYPQC